MTSQTLESIVLSVLIIAFVVYRQIRVRRWRGLRWRLLAVLTAIGVVQTVGYLRGGGTIDVGAVVSVLCGFALAAVLAWPRALSMHVWRRDDGVWMTRGTVWTVLIWIATVAAHLLTSWLVPRLFGHAGSLFGGLDEATVMFYLVITLGVRSWITARYRIGDGQRPGATGPGSSARRRARRSSTTTGVSA